MADIYADVTDLLYVELSDCNQLILRLKIWYQIGLLWKKPKKMAFCFWIN